MNCRLNIINKTLDQVESLIIGRPTFSFDRSKKTISINIGPNSKAKTRTQAEQIAIHTANKINKIANETRFFDNIAIPSGTNVYIKPSTKYIDGMMEFDRLKNSEAEYNEFMKAYEDTKTQLITPSIIDENISMEALKEQENKLDDYISQGIIKSICKL